MINAHGTLFQNKHDLSILGTYKYLFVNHKNKLKCVCYTHIISNKIWFGAVKKLAFNHNNWLEASRLRFNF